LIDALNEAVRKDALGDSAVWAGLFRDFNKPFNGTTGFEWLSRDADEVKKYTTDPLSGFAFTNELARDIFVGFASMRDRALEARTSNTRGPQRSLTASARVGFTNRRLQADVRQQPHLADRVELEGLPSGYQTD